MGISHHVDTFFGSPVKDYHPGRGIKDPSKTIYRLAVDEPYDATKGSTSLTDVLAQFLAEPGSEEARGLVTGMWEEAYSDPEDAGRMVAALVAARDRLPNLRALFFGDIIAEQCEISWIHQTDVSPILAAYPALECLRVRGGDGLVLGTPRHDELRALIIETGGLDGQVVRGIAAGHLPKLEHLELWLGDSGYGATTTVEDLAPILDGSRFPALQYLGLRDSEIADALAIALAGAPIVERIRVLDLSLGNLSDEGAKALLEGSAVAGLQKLDIHHHYVSTGLVEALAGLGIELDVDDSREGDDDDGSSRYVAHSE